MLTYRYLFILSSYVFAINKIIHKPLFTEPTHHPSHTAPPTPTSKF